MDIKDYKETFESDKRSKMGKSLIERHFINGSIELPDELLSILTSSSSESHLFDNVQQLIEEDLEEQAFKAYCAEPFNTLSLLEYTLMENSDRVEEANTETASMPSSMMMTMDPSNNEFMEELKELDSLNPMDDTQSISLSAYDLPSSPTGSERSDFSSSHHAKIDHPEPHKKQSLFTPVSTFTTDQEVPKDNLVIVNKRKTATPNRRTDRMVSLPVPSQSVMKKHPMLDSSVLESNLPPVNSPLPSNASRTPFVAPPSPIVALAQLVTESSEPAIPVVTLQPPVVVPKLQNLNEEKEVTLPVVKEVQAMVSPREHSQSPKRVRVERSGNKIQIYGRSSQQTKTEVFQERKTNLEDFRYTGPLITKEENNHEIRAVVADFDPNYIRSSGEREQLIQVVCCEVSLNLLYQKIPIITQGSIEGMAEMGKKLYNLKDYLQVNDDSFAMDIYSILSRCDRYSAHLQVDTIENIENHSLISMFKEYEKKPICCIIKAHIHDKIGDVKDDRNDYLVIFYDGNGSYCLFHTFDRTNHRGLRACVTYFENLGVMETFFKNNNFVMSSEDVSKYEKNVVLKKLITVRKRVEELITKHLNYRVSLRIDNQEQTKMVVETMERKIFDMEDVNKSRIDELISKLNEMEHQIRDHHSKTPMEDILSKLNEMEHQIKDASDNKTPLEELLSKVSEMENQIRAAHEKTPINDLYSKLNDMENQLKDNQNKTTMEELFAKLNQLENQIKEQQEAESAPIEEILEQYNELKQQDGELSMETLMERLSEMKKKAPGDKKTRMEELIILFNEMDRKVKIQQSKPLESTSDSNALIESIVERLNFVEEELVQFKSIDKKKIDLLVEQLGALEQSIEKFKSSEQVSLDEDSEEEGVSTSSSTIGSATKKKSRSKKGRKPSEKVVAITQDLENIKQEIESLMSEGHTEEPAVHEKLVQLEKKYKDRVEELHQAKTEEYNEMVEENYPMKTPKETEEKLSTLNMKVEEAIERINTFETYTYENVSTVKQNITEEKNERSNIFDALQSKMKNIHERLKTIEEHQSRMDERVTSSTSVIIASIPTTVQEILQSMKLRVGTPKRNKSSSSATSSEESEDSTAVELADDLEVEPSEMHSPSSDRLVDKVIKKLNNDIIAESVSQRINSDAIVQSIVKNDVLNDTIVDSIIKNERLVDSIVKETSDQVVQKQEQRMIENVKKIVEETSSDRHHDMEIIEKRLCLLEEQTTLKEDVEKRVDAKLEHSRFLLNGFNDVLTIKLGTVEEKVERLSESLTQKLVSAEKDEVVKSINLNQLEHKSSLEIILNEISELKFSKTEMHDKILLLSKLYDTSWNRTLELSENVKNNNSLRNEIDSVREFNNLRMDQFHQRLTNVENQIELLHKKIIQVEEEKDANNVEKFTKLAERFAERFDEEMRKFQDILERKELALHDKFLDIVSRERFLQRKEQNLDEREDHFIKYSNKYTTDSTSHYEQQTTLKSPPKNSLLDQIKHHQQQVDYSLDSVLYPLTPLSKDMLQYQPIVDPADRVASEFSDSFLLKSPHYSSTNVSSLPPSIYSSERLPSSTLDFGSLSDRVIGSGSSAVKRRGDIDDDELIQSALSDHDQRKKDALSTPPSYSSIMTMTSKIKRSSGSQTIKTQFKEYKREDKNEEIIRSPFRKYADRK